MSGEGEVRARSRAMEAGALKRKDASASEGGDDNLKTNEAAMVGSLATKPTGEEAQLAGGAMEKRTKLGKKGKEAGASEDYGILKKKKVMLGYRAILDAHLADAAVEAGKKKPKVVKKRLPQGLIDLMISYPSEHIEMRKNLPVHYAEEERRYCGWRNAVADYEKALINQYKAHGYAEDETEASDDDDDDEEEEEEGEGTKACDCGLKRKEASVSEGFDILKKKKVMRGCRDVLDAARLTKVVDKEESQRPGEARRKKRMKVVKKRLPKEIIEVMMSKPFHHTVVYEEYLVHRSLQSRAYSDWKNAVARYEKALIDQYNAQGYAEDEMEATDDEEEMVEN